MNYAYVLFVTLFLSVSCTQNSSDVPASGPTNGYFPPLASTDWTTVTPESVGWSVGNIQALYDYLESTQTRAFVVLHDGKIVLEKYFGANITKTGKFDQNSPWYWASAGKTLTGFVVGKAQEEKFLSIDQKTSAYLGAGWTSLPPAKENLITVRHQLTMTTGLDDGVANSDNTRPSSLVYKADAGTRWAYHNAPYTLLQSVVSKAVGQDFDAYFNVKLKNRIGMDGQWRWMDDNHVYYSTARSMARFGLLMLNQGTWEGQPILNDPQFYTASVTTSQNMNNAYGYLWWLNGKSSLMVPTSQTVFPLTIAPNAPADMIAAMGKNGQLLNIVPSKKLVIMRMGDSPDLSSVPFSYQNEIWKRLSLVVN